MTKKQFIEFAKAYGCQCSYSGKTITMYVKGENANNILIHLSLSTDFKIETDDLKIR